LSSKSDEQSPGGEQSRADTSGEFFSVGTPLHAVKAGYVRRRADDLLYEAVVAGRYAHVIAPGRSGKSSLVAATAARLEANGFNVAVLDLDQIGVRDASADPGRWYYSIAYRILRQLRIRYDLQSWWQDKSILGNRQRLLEFYNEIVLQYVQERIAIFVDGIQSVGDAAVGEQLLASIRSAHNARTTDPEFSRLTFVLLGECDPLSLINEPELSPFSITQSIPLQDFNRADLDLFAAELNLSPERAEIALDRIFYWTRGQPYMTQKLARAVAREKLTEDIDDNVDKIVRQQFTGRAALQNEPHLSHIHREVLRNPKQSEPLLNLYGKLRKGVNVATDLGSPLQRRLMAIGLVRVDDNGDLHVRNRIYESVFTARWANDNLPTHWRAPAMAVGALMLVLAIPFWYTQWLPSSYVKVLTSPTVELETANTAWLNLRSFPGHSGSADNLFMNFLQARAAVASDPAVLETVAAMAAELPESGRLPDELRASFWDRRVRTATRNEQRDDALIASLESLVMSTTLRRHRASMLVGEDYPQLLATLPAQETTGAVFDPGSMLLTTTDGAMVRQWSLTPQGLQRAEDWTMTALEVSPLLRRMVVDREGQVSRIGLTLNISHSRMTDLRIKVIAPSGRTVEIETGRDRASSSEDIRIPAAQMRDLIGEPLNGTWTLSVRDEALGVAGHLVGWNLTLNSQGAIEDFQRGLQIPDPVERNTDNFWVSEDGRYAVARALQSDSARLWDFAYGKPIRAIAAGQNETLIGVDSSARHLLTATLETVIVWDTATGDRFATMQVGPASSTSRLTSDGMHLFVQKPTDTDTRLELWSLEQAELSASLVIGGSPALVALDASGSRVAVADFDRAVRVWDFESGEMLSQIDLPVQPSSISLSASGEQLGVTYGESGVSIWRVDQPGSPIMEDRGRGRWQLRFSPSGASVAAGNERRGYQVYRSEDGSPIGPPLGAGASGQLSGLLAFSGDERVLLSDGPNGTVRFWRIPTDVAPVRAEDEKDVHTMWTPAGEAVVAVTPDAKSLVVGDRGGHVHVLPADVTAEVLAAALEDVSFVGHNAAVTLLEVSADGRLAASVAADNSVRVWNLDNSQPLPHMTDMPGGTVNGLDFSSNGSLLAILNGARAVLLDTSTGEELVEFQPGEIHNAVAFAGDNTVYLGGQSGALRVIARDASGAWTLRQIWQGTAPIRKLAAAPGGRSLVMVDDDNLVKQLNLEEGAIGKRMLALPDTVEALAFSPVGSRIYLRTARWVHRASSSPEGVIWNDAIFGPSPVHGTGIVSKPNESGRTEVFMPVMRAGTVGVARLKFDLADGQGLFGNKDELIADWRARLGMPSLTEQAAAQLAEPGTAVPE
jgi:WD40 repeat protein